jgi:Xaa-Pro dipeptidase
MRPLLSRITARKLNCSLVLIIATAKLHARAVAKRLGVKEGLIFLPGTHSKTYEDSDQDVYFRQRRYFYYLSGINYPNCYVTYDIGRDWITAWIPVQNTGRTVIYNGFSPSRADIRKISDVNYVAETNWLRQYLNCFVKNSPSQSKIYLLHKTQEPKLRNYFLTEDGSNSIAPTSQFDFTKLQPAMDAARVVKSPYELQAIRHACAITADAHINVLARLKTFENESEIEAWFAGTCKQHWVFVLVHPHHLQFYLMHSVLLHTLPQREIRLPKPS